MLILQNLIFLHFPKTKCSKITSCKICTFTICDMSDVLFTSLPPSLSLPRPLSLPPWIYLSLHLVPKDVGSMNKISPSIPILSIPISPKVLPAMISSSTWMVHSKLTISAIRGSSGLGSAINNWRDVSTVERFKLGFHAPWKRKLSKIKYQ